MRGLLALSIVPLLLSAGCLQPDWSIADCQEGEGPHLFKATWGSGYTAGAQPFDLATIGRSGQTQVVVGSIVADAYGGAAKGTGKVVAGKGALHNITTAQAKETLVTMAYYDPTMDFNVTYAFHTILPSDKQEELCRSLVVEFSQLDERYPSELADGGVVAMTASTAQGTHSVRIEVPNPPPEPQDFLTKIDSTLDSAARQVGATYPAPATT